MLPKGFLEIPVQGQERKVYVVWILVLWRLKWWVMDTVILPPGGVKFNYAQKLINLWVKNPERSLASMATPLSKAPEFRLINVLSSPLHTLPLCWEGSKLLPRGMLWFQLRTQQPCQPRCERVLSSEIVQGPKISTKEVSYHQLYLIPMPQTPTYPYSQPGYHMTARISLKSCLALIVMNLWLRYQKRLFNMRIFLGQNGLGIQHSHD